MPIFQAKARSWESYVAGIGATTVLLASGIAMFVVLVGLVTFKTWPHPGDLFGSGGGDVALQNTAKPPPGSSAAPPTLNLVRILGGSGAGAQQGSSTGRVGHGLAPGSGGGSLGPGQLPGGPGGSQPQGAQEPRTVTTQPRNVVSQALSGVGNAVQKDTQSLGDSVNSTTGTNLGDVVTNLGNTLNQNLQSLAGN